MIIYETHVTHEEAHTPLKIETVFVHHTVHHIPHQAI